jgi:hypothetical protein
MEKVKAGQITVAYLRDTTALSREHFVTFGTTLGMRKNNYFFLFYTD